MFKKSSEVKALQRLSGADRKKLKRNIRERLLQASDSDIDAILPPKAEITIAKLTNRAHVYAVEGGPPVFFDVDGRGTDIFPTVGFFEDKPSSKKDDFKDWSAKGVIYSSVLQRPVSWPNTSMKITARVVSDSHKEGLWSKQEEESSFSLY